MTRRIENLKEDFSKVLANTLAEFALENERKKLEDEAMRNTLVECFPITSDEDFLSLEKKLKEPKLRLAAVSI